MRIHVSLCALFMWKLHELVLVLSLLVLLAAFLRREQILRLVEKDGALLPSSSKRLSMKFPIPASHLLLVLSFQK